MLTIPATSRLDAGDGAYTFGDWREGDVPYVRTFALGLYTMRCFDCDTYRFCVPQAEIAFCGPDGRLYRHGAEDLTWARCWACWQNVLPRHRQREERKIKLV